MPSPFPGMDPYIETPDLWPDFHSNLASEIQARLNQVIQPRYAARLTPYVTYEVVEVGEVRGVRPDVGVWQVADRWGAAATAAAVITPPLVQTRVPLELPLTLHTVEIRTTAEQTLVTVIEVLSPVNKRPGHDAYLDYRRKRQDLLRSAVHLLEIDLLREGARPDPGEPTPPPAAYYVLLARADRRPIFDIWPVQLTDPLPVPPVPLLEPDPDVPLDLGACVAAVYERGAYGAQIDYGTPPRGPLSAGESAFLAELLAPLRREIGD